VQKSFILYRKTILLIGLGYNTLKGAPHMKSESFSIKCPNEKCKKDIEITLKEACDTKHVRCKKCRAEIRFNSTVAFQLKNAYGDMVKEIAKYEKAKGKILDKAEIKTIAIG
jgi:hypothetical protein